MLARPLVRISLLVVAVAAITLSCGIDYTLDFEITGVLVGADSVQVTYSMTNSGTRDMDNVAIHIQATADLVPSGTQTLDQWAPSVGVELLVQEDYSETITFTFSGPISDATAIVVGVRWDEHIPTE